MAWNRAKYHQWVPSKSWNSPGLTHSINLKVCSFYRGEMKASVVPNPQCHPVPILCSSHLLIMSKQEVSTSMTSVSSFPGPNLISPQHHHMWFQPTNIMTGIHPLTKQCMHWVCPNFILSIPFSLTLHDIHRAMHCANWVMARWPRRPKTDSKCILQTTHHSQNKCMSFINSLLRVIDNLFFLFISSLASQVISITLGLPSKPWHVCPTFAIAHLQPLPSPQCNMTCTFSHLVIYLERQPISLPPLVLPPSSKLLSSAPLFPLYTQILGPCSFTSFQLLTSASFPSYQLSSACCCSPWGSVSHPLQRVLVQLRSKILHVPCWVTSTILTIP